MAEEKHSARDLEYWYKLWVKSHWDSVVVFDCGGRMLRCEGISLRHVTIIGQCMLIIASKLPDEIIRRFNDSMVNDHMLIDAYVAGVKIGKFAWMLSGGEFGEILRRQVLDLQQGHRLVHGPHLGFIGQKTTLSTLS